MAILLVVHGPNLNLLGRREPDHYGRQTLNSIDAGLRELAAERGHRLLTFQSNAEHEIVERIHRSVDEGIAYIVINPAAFTHTSVAIRDALLGVSVPFIEVHLSNVYRRESFRRRSYFSDVAVGVVSGLGVQGYKCALRAAMDQLNADDETRVQG